MDYSKHVTAPTPQTKAIFGREKEMAKNNAGGVSFVLDPWKQMDRFLVLGTEGGTYYVKERELTQENARAVINCINADGLRAVDRIAEVSIKGLAPKNDAAIFALALACTHGDIPTKADAYAAIRRVCRTGTHLFTFCQAVNTMRGWSRGLRRGVSAYYEKRDISQLGLQLVKYRQRNGWTQRDVVRLAHPKLKDEAAALIKRVIGKDSTINEKGIYQAYLTIQKMTNGKKAAKFLRENTLPWEAIPTTLHGSREVWEALLPGMGLTALLRNLSRLTKLGIIDAAGFSPEAKAIVERFLNESEIAQARLHPLTILNGAKAYAMGRSEKSDATWVPCQKINASLEQAFYKAFQCVAPTGKNHLIGLDVSGSMAGAQIAGTSLSAREASVALAMVRQAVEENTFMTGFSDGIRALDISRGMRLKDAISYTSMLPFDRTDCALPMIYAAHHSIPVDLFEIYTDSETWAGKIHPTEALERYRQKMGRDAKLVVVGMTSTGFTIADPLDTRQLDVVGFSLDTPAAISSFAML